MMLFICSSTKCAAVFRVIADDRELDSLFGPTSDFWPDKYRCAACGDRAIITPEEDLAPSALAGREPRMLEAQEMFRAQYGLGLPEEQDCRREVVEQVLREHPIRKMSGHSVPGSQGFVLEFLELWDGTRLYFCASTHGAMIHRIVTPTNYTKRVLKETHGG